MAAAGWMALTLVRQLLCFVYTCRRLIDLFLFLCRWTLPCPGDAGTQIDEFVFKLMSFVLKRSEFVCQMMQDLDGNEFVGAIPVFLAGCRNLSKLAVNMNNFDFAVSMRSLYIVLTENKDTGTRHRRTRCCNCKTTTLYHNLFHRRYCQIAARLLPDC